MHRLRLAEAVKLLRKTRKLTDLQSKIIEVHRLEDVRERQSPGAHVEIV